MIALRSVETDDHSTRKGVVRATNSTLMVFEEDVNNPRKVYYRIISQVDLKGQIPSWAIYQGSGKEMLKVVEDTFQSYRKNVSKWKAMKQ